MTVRTRFSPSPTGTPESVHLGFVIRALWAYAYAKKSGGQFVLRLEDTDQKRSREDTEKAIYYTLHEFGIFWDEGPDVGGPYGPYRQSERLSKYQAAAHELVSKGFAYYDFDAKIREKEEVKAAYESEETLAEVKTRPEARNMDPVEAKKRVDAGESFVIRAKIPENRVFEFDDWILKKKVKFMAKEVPDLILLKSDGFPTYHLAVVVDDLDMKISHVFRGQEWISTTPVHLYVYEGLGRERPEIGHFTVILDPRTKKKFSKRDLTAMFGVRPWIEKGYLHEAILNYLMLLGWAPKDNRELFTLDEFVEAFDREGMQKANPTFNTEKLNWFNQQYIRALDDVTLGKKVLKFTRRSDTDVAKVLPLVKERMVTLKDFDDLTSYFFETPDANPGILPQGAPVEEILEHAALVLTLDWDGKILEENARRFCAERSVKVGDYFLVLRVAVTGVTKTPPFWDVIEILGMEETLDRIKKLIAKIKQKD